MARAHLPHLHSFFMLALCITLSACGPNSDFSAQSHLDNNQQEYGVLTWNADLEKVDGFFIERMSITPDIGEVGFAGEITVYPVETTTYTMQVETRNENGLIYHYARTATVYIGPRVNYALVQDQGLRDCLQDTGNTHLEQFDVIYCLDRGITQLEGIEQFQQTQSVSLDNNHILDLSPLTALNQLAVVSVSGNDLVALDALTQSASIRNIAAHNNRILDLNALSMMPQIITLTLDNNQISDTTPLQTLPQLQGLSISYNQIEDVSPLANNTELLALDISNNPVNSGIPALNALTKATLIRSENNGDVPCLNYAQLILALGPVVVFNQCRFF